MRESPALKTVCGQFAASELSSLKNDNFRDSLADSEAFKNLIIYSSLSPECLMSTHHVLRLNRICKYSVSTVTSHSR